MMCIVGQLAALRKLQSGEVPLYIRWNDGERDQTGIEVPTDATVEDVRNQLDLPDDAEISFQAEILQKESALSDVGVAAESTLDVVWMSRIYVHVFSRKNLLTVDVDPGMEETVRDIRWKIRELYSKNNWDTKYNFPNYLCIGRMKLQDDKPLKYYNIQKEGRLKGRMVC